MRFGSKSEPRTGSGELVRRSQAKWANYVTMDRWVNHRRNAFLISSPYEDQVQLKALRAKTCTPEGARKGFKAACIWGVFAAVPTLAAVRMFPWAKHNLNYTAQALIISAASIASYFITADKTILECARKNAQLQQALSRQQ